MLLEVSAYAARYVTVYERTRKGLQVWGTEMIKVNCIYHPLTCGYETY